MAPALRLCPTGNVSQRSSARILLRRCTTPLACASSRSGTGTRSLQSSKQQKSSLRSDSNTVHFSLSRKFSVSLPKPEFVSCIMVRLQFVLFYWFIILLILGILFIVRKEKLEGFKERKHRFIYRRRMYWHDLKGLTAEHTPWVGWTNQEFIQSKNMEDYVEHAKKTALSCGLSKSVLSCWVRKTESWMLDYDWCASCQSFNRHFNLWAIADPGGRASRTSKNVSFWIKY